MKVKAPMKGAVNSQIRAHTIHENTQIRCLTAGISSAVHVTSTVWEHVVAIFDNIANIISRVTFNTGLTKT